MKKLLILVIAILLSSAAQVALAKDLGLTIGEFKTRWNALDAGIPLKKIKRETGEIARYTVDFGDDLTLTAFVQNDKVYSVLAGLGSDSPKTAFKMMMVINSIIGVTNPTLKPNERGDVMRKLKIIGDNMDFSPGDTRNVKINGVQYSIAMIEGIGLMFEARSPN